MKDKVLILILLCLIGVTTPIVIKKFKKPNIPVTVSIDTSTPTENPKDIWEAEWEKDRD